MPSFEKHPSQGWPRMQEYVSGLPHGCEGPNYLSHHLLPESALAESWHKESNVECQLGQMPIAHVAWSVSSPVHLHCRVVATPTGTLNTWLPVALLLLKPFHLYSLPITLFSDSQLLECIVVFPNSGFLRHNLGLFI